MLSLQITATVGIAACYIALCKILRYLRRDQQHSQMPYKTREDFQKMTAEDAWQIIKYVQSLEFPWITKKALSFALFRYALSKNKNYWIVPNIEVELTAYLQSPNYYARHNSSAKPNMQDAVLRTLAS